MQLAAKARAADLAPIIAELQAAGAESLRAIAAGLNARGIPTTRGYGQRTVLLAPLLNQVNRAGKSADERRRDHFGCPRTPASVSRAIALLGDSTSTFGW
jgi:hypothetical protein